MLRRARLENLKEFTGQKSEIPPEKYRDKGIVGIVDKKELKCFIIF